MKTTLFKSVLLGSACAASLATVALGEDFNIPAGSLNAALNAYSKQAGVPLIVSADMVRGAITKGVAGNLPPEEALSRILSGTGFTVYHDPAGALGIARGRQSTADVLGGLSLQLAQAAPPRAAVETVTVTSSKLGGADVQSIPIAITALSQEQLTSTQTAGGPDLVRQVPNLTFTKTNFSGYSIQIRGIGTQAISVTTDPAVAVAFNDTPFIRNHFFEQEFYDVSQVEVLRGPQGTLYGRNATAGVVNVASAKPTDQFEAMASADIGNFKNRRLEGMINIPFDSDKLDFRIAGEWTKRDGYSFNETAGQQTDGRDLWSGRATLGWKPIPAIQAYFIWEHFQEDDDRLRSGKQTCKTDPGPTSFTAADGSTVPVAISGLTTFALNAANFSQGCLPTSLYSSDAFQVPNGYALPFVSGPGFLGQLNIGIDPYSQTVQSTNLRNIQSVVEPKYIAKNDTLEFNASWNITPSLTFYTDTGYNRDFLWSTEDYNRFDTSPGVFAYFPDGFGNFPNPAYMRPDPNFPPNPNTFPPYGGGAILCDPQLGCSSRLVVEDLSTEKAWQFSQEFRLASSLNGPLNFSVGGNFLHYETVEKYYVFSNGFGLFTAGGPNASYIPGESDNLDELTDGRSFTPPAYQSGLFQSAYIDPHSLTNLDDQGHNYFLSLNPYNLNSYALFGEAYYNITDDLKLTGGLRWTDDQKHFVNYPSELLTVGYGYPSTGTVDQVWSEWTGRAVANWTPKLSFTDQSMFYASFSHGYKAGGANPPGAHLLTYQRADISFPTHPLTFAPEFINAYEIGTKNTALDGALTFNGDVFFYDYKGYQISQIVDRTSVNLNFDATVKGAELEATWEPVPGLKFSFGGGYESTKLANNQSAIDLMDRTAGQPGWVLMRPWVGQASNCIFPEYVAAALIQAYGPFTEGNQGASACAYAYNTGVDPVTLQPYSATTYPITLPSRIYDLSSGTAVSGGPVTLPPMSYSGFDPATAPNNGEGFSKDVSGNELPNAPHFTVTLGADYTLPVTQDWAMTLHSDFYWQSESWARVFNDDPYDRIRGYKNVNFALTFTDTSGWQVMGYVKNVFDTTAITGDFLNSDDSGLTTNIFLTDPRLFGVRVTKRFDSGGPAGSDALDFLDTNKAPQVWIQVGGNFSVLNAGAERYTPAFESVIPSSLPVPSSLEKSPTGGFDWEGKLSIQPEDSDWVLKAGIRYGRSSKKGNAHVSLPTPHKTKVSVFGFTLACTAIASTPHALAPCETAKGKEFEDTQVQEREQHMMLDFTLGKDVGLGAFGSGGTSTISGGVRIAQFNSKVSVLINTDPHFNFPEDFTQKYHDIYNGTSEETHGFRGIGPELTWDANSPILGNSENGEVTLDWGVNAAVLFGRQRTTVDHQTYHKHCTEAGQFHTVDQCYQVYDPAIKAETYSRSKRVTVPNIGGYIGASARYHNSKISFGYRADTFFNTVDGGQETAKSYSRGFYGPYLNVSLGL